MSTTIQVSQYPDCDLCILEGYRPPHKARYDSPTTIDSRWANLCPTHWRQYSPHHQLGTGLGQRLVLTQAQRTATRRRP